MNINKEYMERIAPCGLHCGKCFAFINGDIQNAAVKLRDNLMNFEPYAKRFETMFDSAFKEYPEFSRMLNYFADAKCGGCRKEKCKFNTTCKVRSCSEAHGVDFCCECDEFPCLHTGLDENLYKRYITMNKRIKEIGAEAYYDEIKDVARYQTI